jgi:hypothetical protein
LDVEHALFVLARVALAVRTSDDLLAPSTIPPGALVVQSTPVAAMELA